MDGRHGPVGAAAAALALVCALVSGCGGHGRAEIPTPPPTATAAGGSPLAVKIDNVPGARPQTGLDAADVVYAEQVEGGLSRLMAVYASRLPPVVGPVRSARESDLELLGQFHRPYLAFSGAQRRLLPLIDRAPLRPEPADRAPAAYYRDGTRAAPHNLFLRPARLVPSAPGRTALTTGFRYGPAPSGGTPAASRTVRYPQARFTFTWSAARHGWLIAMDGTPTTTTDGPRPAPPTVVVQYVTVRDSAYHDVLGNPTPFTRTVGTGKAEVLRDGRSYAATWSRPAASGGTTFTGADGAPLDFAEGQVWVVFARAR
ncbi:Protein of unknown function [Streptomyces misionensis]|uniref:DUF3048 domain-containing protein n=1 Tax=Streptomyces misionensis TaxID=67331 RepID=A0A1H5EVM2_9ACTN|nr:DUF3048 domain-containing protein [Streptomyces misionensis]SED95151.1 Protein of unknown function [Streptomyces misionensis]